jgi:hypothetical protein
VTYLEGTSERLFKDFIPDRACLSRGILAFPWLVQEATIGRDSSEDALFSWLVHLYCEITFGNLLSQTAWPFLPGHTDSWTLATARETGQSPRHG